MLLLPVTIPSPSARGELTTETPRHGEAEQHWASAADDTLGLGGLALERMIIVSCRAWCPNQFTATAAHEFAHLPLAG
jgi:hypothetical protein